MKSSTWYERGIIAQQVLVAGVLFAFASLVGVIITNEPLADMRIEPPSGLALKGNTIQVRLVVEASTPVNVFKGEITFDPAQLHVQSIDYNTSIADLWAEKPWYENGAGTVNFIGGTTQEGGFSGEGSLMTITFETLELGDSLLHLNDARILAHDGLGTFVPLNEPIDALFTVESPELKNETIATPSPSPSSIAVVQTLPRTDLNGDGRQSIIDVSIFMAGMITKDSALDFNNDGSVDTKDLSIMLGAK